MIGLVKALNKHLPSLELYADVSDATLKSNLKKIESSWKKDVAVNLETMIKAVSWPSQTRHFRQKLKILQHACMSPGCCSCCCVVSFGVFDRSFRKLQQVINTSRCCISFVINDGAFRPCSCEAVRVRLLFWHGCHLYMLRAPCSMLHAHPCL